ncbi:MAG: hypothetical protein U0169_07420 [Polyangiaceae bacterium]
MRPIGTPVFALTLAPILAWALPSTAFADMQADADAGAATPASGTPTTTKVDATGAAGTAPATLPALPPAQTAPATPGASTPPTRAGSGDASGTTTGQAGIGVAGTGTASEKPPANPDDLLVTGSAGARAAGMAPPGTRSSDFMDTRLTWTFGDDDFLHKTGELVPLSPAFSIGDRPQYRMFFDNLNSRFAGRENLTHLVMYKKLPGFITNLTTEAAMVLRLDLASLSANTGNLNAALYDSGSYIKVHYRTGGTDAKPEGLSATFFPLDTDRFRLGYLYDISWGGTAANINQSIFPRIQGASPGLKLQFDMPDRFYAFVGFKTATIIQPQQVLAGGGEADVETVRVGETNFGFLGGAGADFTKNFRLDFGGGYFQQGKFELEDVRGKPVSTAGVSARAIVHHNMPVPQSIDFLLYRNDPTAPMVLFAPPKVTPGVAWSVSAEGTALSQQLKDFDAAGKTKNQAAIAGALQGVLTVNAFRASATGILRDLNYVVRNVPGFIPFETLPKDSTAQTEVFGALAADYYFEKLRLTPGISAGIQLPATFKSTFTQGGIPASRTVVVRQQGDESILPYNKGRAAIIQVRYSVKWSLSDMLSAVLWVQHVTDNNATLVVRDPNEGTASLRVFQSPTRLGAGVALQARF